MSIFIHNTTVIDNNVSIGVDTKIWHFSHILSETIIGERCSFGQNCVVGPRVKIGNGVKVQNNISIYEGVEIEDDVFLGPSMVFTNVVNPRSFIVRKDEFKKTLLKKGCSIGANSTIVCGLTVGEYALIGAGTVVTRNVKPFDTLELCNILSITKDQLEERLTKAKIWSPRLSSVVVPQLTKKEYD